MKIMFPECDIFLKEQFQCIHSITAHGFPTNTNWHLIRLNSIQLFTAVLTGFDHIREANDKNIHENFSWFENYCLCIYEL